jgi:hypothetical protein
MSLTQIGPFVDWLPVARSKVPQPEWEVAQMTPQSRHRLSSAWRITLMSSVVLLAVAFVAIGGALAVTATS